jgi:hypothetical protein
LNLGLFAHETLAYFTTLGKLLEVSPEPHSDGNWRAGTDF